MPSAWAGVRPGRTAPVFDKQVFRISRDDCGRNTASPLIEFLATYENTFPLWRNHG